MPTLPPTPTEPSPSRIKRIFRLWRRVLLGLVLLLVVLIISGYVLIQQPSVQQYILQEFTSKMAEEWKVAFSIDRVEVLTAQHYRFYNVYLEDPNQDTLLYAGLVEAKGVDWWKIWSKKHLAIEQARVKNAVFKVQRWKQQRYFSIDYLIDYFQKEVPVPVEKRFKWSIDTALVEALRCEFRDVPTGIAMTAAIEQVYTTAYAIDLIGKRAWLDTFSIRHSQVQVAFQKPLPIADTLPPSPYTILTVGRSHLPWDIKCSHLALQDFVGQLLLPKKKTRNKKKPFWAVFYSKHKQLDPLQLQAMQLKVDSLEWYQDQYQGQVKELSASLANGLGIRSFYGDFRITRERATLRRFRLKTKGSSIGNTVVMSYKNYAAFKDFINQVYVSFYLSDCHFALAEIGLLAPSLLDNILFRWYKKATINISGEYQGLLKYFEWTDVDIQLGKDVTMDKKQAAKNTPAEWFIKTFAPKNKARRARDRATRKKEAQKK